MRLRDHIFIDASPEAIWRYVGDPRQWLGFHPKVVRVDQAVGTAPAVDAWYDIEFETNGRRLLHRSRVAEVEPCRRLRLEADCAGPGDRRLRVDMVYELRPRRSRTKVLECFEIRNHGIPWPAVILVQCIHRWGTAQDSSALQQLQELLERART